MVIKCQVKFDVEFCLFQLICSGFSLSTLSCVVVYVTHLLVASPFVAVRLVLDGNDVVSGADDAMKNSRINKKYHIKRHVTKYYRILHSDGILNLTKR